MKNNSSIDKSLWGKCLIKFNEYLKSNDFKTAVELVAKDFNLTYDEAYKLLFPPK
ncbi:MAG: hypothetical protein ACTSRP_06070 [Candidatus Helarchaeota archaeon]